MIKLNTFLMIVFLAAPALAEMIPTVIVDSVVVPPSDQEQLGNIEIWIDYDGATAIDLAGFQLAINLTGPDSAIRFTNVGAPGNRSYLFSPTSPAPIGSVSGNGRSIELGDFLLTGLASLDSGKGLARIAFSVEPNTVGTYSVEISLDPLDSFLATGSSDFALFQVQNGTISAVPEPTSILLSLAFLTIIGARVRRGLMA